MKTAQIIFTSLFSVILFSFCSSTKILNNENGYLIIKTDSINNWYIIYANKNDTLFKILSPKNYAKSYCVKITKGKVYDLTLYSMFDSMRKTAPIIGGIRLVPQNYLDVHCFNFGYSTYICIEPEKGINDLYFCENLAGLCFK